MHISSPYVSDILYNLAPVLGYAEYGFIIGYSSSTKDMLVREKRLASWQTSWFASSIFLSAALGNIIGALAAEKWGRKITLLFSTLPFSIGWLLIIFDGHVSILFIGRLLCGLGVGIITIVCPLYVGEIARPQNRGLLLASQRTALTLGSLLSFLLALWLSWLWLAVVGNVITAMLALGCLLLPESPYWHLQNGQLDAARHSLLRLRMGDDGQANRDLQTLISESRDSLVTQSQQKLAWKRVLIDRQLRMPVIIVVLLQVFQHFSGSLVILSFLTQIFADEKVSNPLLPSIVVGSTRVLFALVASLLVDRVGRKGLLICSSVVVVVMHVTIGLTYYLEAHYTTELSWVALASIIIFYGAIALGWGPIPNIILGEVLPYSAKGALGGFVSSIGTLTAFAATEAFDLLESAIQPYGAFWVLAGINVIAIAVTAVILPETKHKTLKEIESLFIK